MVTPFDTVEKQLPTIWMDNIAAPENPIVDTFVEITLHKYQITSVAALIEQK